MWERFAGKKVALLGAGKENVSLIPLLLESGAKVAIFEWQTSTSREDVEIVSGDDYLRHLEGYDYAFRSPGFPVKTVSQAVSKLKVKPEITSPMNLLLEILPGTTIGVTGTKGKGTTSTMIGSILSSAGKKVLVAGNIGETVFDHLHEIDDSSFTVLELSSFQLEDMKFSPHVAVLLPITSEHLQPLSASSPNYHETLEDYIEAKGQLTLHQGKDDFLVYAFDAPATAGLANRTRAKKYGISRVSAKSEYTITDQGWLTQQGKHWLDLSKTGLTGEHNWLNASLASVVAKTLGISDEQIVAGLKAFRPLPHRMERFLTANNIAFVDDSYATAPDATMAALTAFTEPVIWLGGGSDKGADFSELAREIKKSSVKSCVLIGVEAPKISAALKKYAPKIPQQTFKTFEEAVECVARQARSGDVVLLSPACASKDMFKDAAERGAIFQELVKKYAAL